MELTFRRVTLHLNARFCCAKELISGEITFGIHLLILKVLQMPPAINDN